MEYLRRTPNVKAVTIIDKNTPCSGNWRDIYPEGLVMNSYLGSSTFKRPHLQFFDWLPMYFRVVSSCRDC